MLVFGWRTFPVLRPIYLLTDDLFVGKLSALSQPRSPTLSSISPGSLNE